MNNIEKLIEAVEISAKNAEWDDFDNAIHALKALQSSEPVAIKAKPIEWEQDVYDWYGSEWGFHISYDSLEKEGQEYSACWGEGDSETFATLDEAKDWCQDTADAYISSVACITHPPASVPLEKYNKLLKQRDDAIKALGDLSFECFAGIGLTQPSIKTYNDTFMVLDRLRKEIAEWK